jgi:ABC-type multidrug transport system fused ATPase/permease subunit
MERTESELERHGRRIAGTVPFIITTWITVFVVANFVNNDLFNFIAFILAMIITLLLVRSIMKMLVIYDKLRVVAKRRWLSEKDGVPSKKELERLGKETRRKGRMSSAALLVVIAIPVVGMTVSLSGSLLMIAISFWLPFLSWIPLPIICKMRSKRTNTRARYRTMVRTRMTAAAQQVKTIREKKERKVDACRKNKKRKEVVIKVLSVTVVITVVAFIFDIATGFNANLVLDIVGTITLSMFFIPASCSMITIYFIIVTIEDNDLGAIRGFDFISRDNEKNCKTCKEHPRTCVACGKKIKYCHYINMNQFNPDRETIWYSSVVAIPCCQCLSKLKRAGWFSLSRKKAYSRVTEKLEKMQESSGTGCHL